MAWPRAAPAAVVTLFVIGCQTGGAGTTAALERLRPLPAHPGKALTGERVMVLPVSSLRGGDAAGWAAAIASPRDFLQSLNVQIARALPARAFHTTWVLPAEMARVAARNAGYAPDPYTIDASLLAPDRWRPGGILPDPLAGQLRTLTSFTDARIALIPVEVRFLPRPGSGVASDGRGRAVLRVALADTRLAAVMWAGDVASDSASGPTPEVMAALADRLADALATP